MRRLAPVILAACSAGSIPDAGVVAPGPALAPISAAHGAAISLLAATDDGGAVVTQDASGGTRLWPVLDGTQEPLVVALVRAGDGFVIAVLDVAGASSWCAPGPTARSGRARTSHQSRRSSRSPVRLYASDATPVWEVAAPLAQNLGWIGNELIGQFAGGLARFDRLTGNLDRQSCGWSFGLRALPPREPTTGVESICDAL